MCNKLIWVLIFLINSLYLEAKEQSINSLFGESNNACSQIKAVFFDLGDTLVESAGNGQFQLRIGAQQMIDELLLNGIRIGIITNVPSSWSLSDLEAILVDASFLDDFESIVLSSQAPAAKPDPAIFNYAYSLINNPPVIEEFAFVTENLSDIANFETNPTLGARSVGMIGIHLSDNLPSPLTDYTVIPDDFETIVEIIQKVIFCNGFE